MIAIFKREFRSFFYTPIGYVFIGIFSGLAGVIFYTSNLKTLSGEVLLFFSQLTVLIMLLSPMLTMRLLCEERQKRTEPLLMTSPVSLGSIVWGKYFAAAAVLFLAILLTNVFTLIIGVYGTLFWSEWFVGTLGLVLQSLAFLALDLLVTCFSKNQISAAMAAFGANFLLWMVDLVARYISVGFLSNALNFISLYGRYEPFILGQLSFANVLFYLSFIIACMVCAIHVMDTRRFARGGAA